MQSAQPIAQNALPKTAVPTILTETIEKAAYTPSIEEIGPQVRYWADPIHREPIVAGRLGPITEWRAVADDQTHLGIYKAPNVRLSDSELLELAGLVKREALIYFSEAEVAQLGKSIILVPTEALPNQQGLGSEFGSIVTVDSSSPNLKEIATVMLHEYIGHTLAKNILGTPIGSWTAFEGFPVWIEANLDPNNPRWEGYRAILQAYLSDIPDSIVSELGFSPMEMIQASGSKTNNLEIDTWNEEHLSRAYGLLFMQTIEDTVTRFYPDLNQAQIRTRSIFLAKKFYYECAQAGGASLSEAKLNDVALSKMAETLDNSGGFIEEFTILHSTKLLKVKHGTSNINSMSQARSVLH